MAMTMTEKIIADHAGLKNVSPGQVVYADIDLVFANDHSAYGAIGVFSAIDQAKKVFDPGKIVIVPDHRIPCNTVQDAREIKAVRVFAMREGIKLYDVGRSGIGHVLLPEEGLVLPGQLVVGGDSHTCTYGALGLLSVGVGATDTAAGWASGKIWLRVPPTIKLIYKGNKRPWVTGKDLILYTLGELGPNEANYKALEFSGDAIEQLGMADRLTMANMVVEAGAKNGIFPVDDQVVQYVNARTGSSYSVYESDPDAVYENTHLFELEEIEPQVAFPPSPSNVKPISRVGDISIDQVVIGSCTNGRIEDLRIAAGLMKGRKIHPRLRCIVIPGSQKVYMDAMKEGLLEIFIGAECVVTTPTCGPCYGGHTGIMAEGERCLSTTNRNFVGRMGPISSEVYLASPAVAAATALKGFIADPSMI